MGTDYNYLSASFREPGRISQQRSFLVTALGKSSIVFN